MHTGNMHTVQSTHTIYCINSILIQTDQVWLPLNHQHLWHFTSRWLVCNIISACQHHYQA